MRVALSIGLVALAVSGCSLTKPEEEPAYIKATAVEGRVERIERQSDAMLELQRQQEAMQTELRRLRGELEEAQHEAKSAKDQQRDLYADLDKRIGALEGRVQTLGTAAPGGAAAAGNDKDAYQTALDKLKTRDYAGAEKSLVDFMASYPQSALVDNAQYWLGETYYVMRRYPDAVEAFGRVLRDHPDSRKVPDALLKLGYSEYELQRFREARQYLAKLLKGYPDTPAATEAQQRLKRMDAEHH